MISKPRLYARTRTHRTTDALSSKSKPDVLVLLDEDADSKLIIDRLRKVPILCQVIVLADVNALDHYYRSHDNSENDNQCVYLVQSSSFVELINESVRKNEDFYTIETCTYTLDLNKAPCQVYELFQTFNEEEELAKSLRAHLNSCLTLSDVELSSQSVSMETPRFAWFQFMFTLLSGLERSNIGLQEVINRFRTYYNKRHHETVEEFIQTYSLEKAIEWCMKDSFYFGHINRRLRSKDIKDIFTHRTIIRDLEQCLMSWHNEQEQYWDILLPMHVYRGQKTSKQELQSWQSHIGSIITMNSFLSTSMDKQIAMVFTETFGNDDNDDEATLFTIWIDKKIASKAIFAYLYHADSDPDDQEILFSLRTLFRIDKVKYSEFEETWLVNMTLVDDTYEEVQRVLNPWKTSILQEDHFLPSTSDSLIYVRDLSADNGAFLSLQLSLDIILRLDRNEFARQEMLSMCRTQFSHEPLVLTKINRFDLTYRSADEAARWYTADSFVYRLLNEVLRRETIDSIFKLRYYIQDLHNQLALMQVDYFDKLQRNNMCVIKLYRGQTMTRADLNNKFLVNQGNLISMNSFLSTTTDRYTARLFSGDGFVEHSDTHVSVLYEITVDIRLPHSVPFAELIDQTHFEDEDEVLFSMGSVFCIGETYEEHKDLWTVKLTLTTDEDEQWNVLTEHLHQEEEEELSKKNQSININKEQEIGNCVETKIKKKRSRSFDNYRWSKRDFQRSDWPEAFRSKMIRRFEHPAFRLLNKEI